MNNGKTSKLILILAALIIIIYLNKAQLITSAYPVYRSLSGSLIDRSLEGYKTFDYNNLTIYHTPEDKNALGLIKQISDEYSKQVLGFFDISEDYPIGIIIFSTEMELKGIFRIPENYSAMGAYFGGKIGLLSPSQYDSYNQSMDMLENVYVHELTHQVLDNLANGNLPIWFTEGTALFMEYDVLGYEWGKTIPLHDLSYSIDDLTRRFSDLDEYVAYRQSFLIVKGLIEEYGRDKFLSMVKMLGNGENFSNAVKGTYGLKQGQLNRYR